MQRIRTIIASTCLVFAGALCAAPPIDINTAGAELLILINLDRGATAWVSSGRRESSDIERRTVRFAASMTWSMSRESASASSSKAETASA